MSLNETEDPIELIRQSGADPKVLGRIWDHYRDRLRRVVRLRLDRRLQGRADPSDVLQEAFLDFQSRAAEYANSPDMPFYLWLRFLTGQRLQLFHRHHLGTQMRDAVASLADHRLVVSLDAPATPERVLAAVDDIRARFAALTATPRELTPAQ